MLKKYLTLALCGLLFQLFISGPISAMPPARDKETKAEKVKQSVEKLGTGVKARVKVKLKDGTVHKGYIYEAGDSSFTVMEEKTAQKVVVPYADVAGIGGKNMSTGKKIAVGVGIGAAAFVIAGSILFIAIVKSF